jgi:hypothetical protein
VGVLARGCPGIVAYPGTLARAGKAAQLSRTNWFKGNIHTHTNAGGPRTGYPHGDPVADSDPETVTRWYRRHGYDFLVLTDHNHRTLLDHSAGKRRFRRPLMIPGEEVSVRIHQGTVPIHIGGIGISREVEPTDAGEVVPTIQANVDAVLQAGGIASINHPNLGWAFDHEAISQVTGASLLEVFNGVPWTNTHGGTGLPGNEEIWDRVLSAGRAIFGVATDDSHHFRDFSHDRTNPGRGWVVVRATELSSDAIVDGLATGDFYSSTGVTLADLELSQDSISLKIEQDRQYAYTTTFTGRDGVALAREAGPEAIYRVRGDEGYVRATVRSSSGAKVWTQPVFLPHQ